MSYLRIVSMRRFNKLWTNACHRVQCYASASFEDFRWLGAQQSHSRLNRVCTNPHIIMSLIWIICIHLTDKLLGRARRQEGCNCPPGPKGNRGIPGLNGINGTKCEKGDPGSHGERGEKGELGLPGSPGPQGSQGLNGTKGEQGEIGQPENVGQKGDLGLKA